MRLYVANYVANSKMLQIEERCSKWGDWNEDFLLYQICHISYISYMCSKLSDTEFPDSGEIICSKSKKYVADV